MKTMFHVKRRRFTCNFCFTWNKSNNRRLMFHVEQTKDEEKPFHVKHGGKAKGRKYCQNICFT